jgi:hypothetical protein
MKDKDIDIDIGPDFGPGIDIDIGSDHRFLRWLARLLILIAERPRRKGKLNFALGLEGGYIVEGEVMALTLTAVQQASLSVKAVDAKGNPAEVENVVFDGSDPNIITLLPDAEDPTTAWVVAVGTPGNAQVTVTADADIGEGEKNLQGILDVTVVAAEAVALEIEAGVPEDQPTEPPVEPPPTTIEEPAHPEHPISPGLPYPIPHKKSGPTRPAGRATRPAPRKR